MTAINYRQSTGDALTRNGKIIMLNMRETESYMVNVFIDEFQSIYNMDWF